MSQSSFARRWPVITVMTVLWKPAPAERAGGGGRPGHVCVRSHPIPTAHRRGRSYRDPIHLRLREAKGLAGEPVPYVCGFSSDALPHLPPRACFYPLCFWSRWGKMGA